MQVVVGSFVVDSNKELKSDSQTEPVFTSQMPNPVGFGHLTGGGGGASSPSHGTPSESSSGDPDSPLNNSSGARDDDNNNNHPQGMSGMPWK